MLVGPGNIGSLGTPRVGVNREVVGIPNLPPTWVTASGSLGAFSEDAAVDVTVMATDDGIPAPMDYSITDGALPSGLSLNESTGQISGTLTDDPGDYSFTISAYDGEFAVQRSFTITIIALDDYFGSVALLLPMSGDLNDHSPNGLAVTNVGSISLSDADPKFGSFAAEFAGTSVSGNQYLKVENSVLAPGPTDDYTIEGWFQTTDIHGDQACFALREGTTNRLLVECSNSSGGFRAYSGGGSPIMSLGTHFVVNTWHHIAVVRDFAASLYYFYFDGVQIGTMSDAKDDHSAIDNIEIGTWTFNSDRDWQGYIQDFRYTIGVKRYTDDFTPPSYPHQGYQEPIQINGNNGVYLMPSFDTDSAARAFTLGHDSSGDLTYRSNFQEAQFVYSMPDGYSEWGGTWDTALDAIDGFTVTNGGRDIQNTNSSSKPIQTSAKHNTGKRYGEFQITAVATNKPHYIFSATGYTGIGNAENASGAIAFRSGAVTFNSMELNSVYSFAVDFDNGGLVHVWKNGDVPDDLTGYP